MSFGRAAATVRSLRFRLAAWNALGVAIVGAAALWSVREGVRVALIQEIDAVLQDDLREIELILSDPHLTDSDRRAELVRKSEGHLHHTWFVQFLGEDDREIWATSDRPESFRAGGRPESAATSREGYRLAAKTAVQPPGRPVVVRVGASLQFASAQLARVDRTAALAAAAVAIGSPLAGFLLAGRATRPIQHIVSTAKSIRPDRLDERLPLRGAGDELDDLSRTINDLLDRLAAHLDHHRQFVANAAHELRSPLAAMKNAAEVGLARRREVHEYEVLLQENIEEIDSLAHLVDQLLLLTECETDRLKVHGEPTQLDEIVGRGVDVFQAMADAKDVRLRLVRREAATVAGNPRHLRVLVNNLLDNAIKFTPPGGAVEASVYPSPAERRAAGKAILEVVDTGQGISGEDLPRVFDRFYRSDPARSRVEGVPGSGLGLSICKSIVDALGGDIRVQSRLGAGARFIVELPAPTRAEAPDAPDARAARV